MESITQPVFVPVILGTSRQGRASEHAARFAFEQVSERRDMKTELIDIRNIRLSIVWMAPAMRFTRENIPS
jgi:hypothetical protein